jgi:2-polyprenyl-6-methoxyphenol hydroxylase-like FAD-dependent oxidoreductase
LVSETDWSAEKNGSKMRLSIYQTDLQYALMKCVQELKAIVDAQGAEIAALKGQP